MVLSRLRTLAATLCFFGLFVPISPSLADSFYAPAAPNDDAPDFIGHVEFGYTRLSGNTNTETVLGKTQLTWLNGARLSRFRAEARHASEDSETSAERYMTSFRQRRELVGPHYLFAFGRWEKDRFSGYDHQFTAITGYGRQILDSPRAHLELEAGPGYRADILPDEDDQRLAVAYGAMEAGYILSASASLEQELSVETTRKNSTLRSYTALDTRINAHMSLRLSHEIKHNSDPPEDAEARTDRITSASLRYEF
ncbi:DUF481 domain-containing protein [Halomonas cupida]|uniref:DUF481 domain-containing protein n=1 Tax=Halomonas cupida TaxID=44933 RepID=UPI003EF4C8BF